MAQELPDIGQSDPASLHCIALGGFEEIRTGPGGEYGVCMLPDGSECESWALYRGECAPAGGQTFQKAFRYQQIGLMVGGVAGLVAYGLTPQKSRPRFAGILGLGPIVGALAGGLIGMPRKATQ